MLLLFGQLNYSFDGIVNKKKESSESQRLSTALIALLISKKKTHQMMSQITWQRAIFTGASPAIVAADMLNFCVRDENRCVHIAIATRSL